MPETNASTPTRKPEIFVEYDMVSRNEADWLHELDKRIHAYPDVFTRIADNVADGQPTTFDDERPRPEDDSWLFGFAASSRGGRLYEFDRETEGAIGEDDLIKNWIQQRNQSNTAVAPEFTAKIRARRLGMYAGRVSRALEKDVVIDLTEGKLPRQPSGSDNTVLRTSA